MNGKVRAKILLVIMILLTVILAMNKQRVNILERNEKLIKTTTQTKEKLLEKESKKDSNTITGSVYEKETGEFKEGIEVELYEAEEEKKVEIAYTDKDGNYKFTNVKKGEYTVGITDKNYQSITNNNVSVENQNSQDVNIEIEEKDEFKAEIKKYVKEIKINNNGKEETYSYDRQDKVNLPIKNLKNLTGEITYEFEVTNKKEKEGTVKVIKDILPEGLSFKKEKNENWREKDGKLYTSILSKETIKKGETKKVQLVLDINNTDEARRYLNKVSITGEVYHKVVYDSLGSVYKEEDVIDGTIIEKIEEPKVDGYIFDDFYEDEELTKKYDFDEPITKDTVIYIGWKQAEDTYTVTFMDKIGETEYKQYGETKKIKNGEKVEKPKTPVREHYTFMHWSLEKEGEEYDFDEPITKDIVLYAVYKINTYNVEFYNGDDKVNSQSIEAGGLIVEPEKPKKEGYTFKYWSLSKNGEEYNLLTPVLSHLKLYAVYSINEYSIEFYDKGKSIKTLKVEYNSMIDSNEVPEVKEEGKTFKGWYEEGKEDPFSFTTHITKNIKLYSKYEDITNKVIFNDDNRIEEVEVVYGNPVTAPESKGKEGHHFLYWSEEVGGEEFNLQTPITQGMTLYAVYEKNTYTVTFMNEGEQYGEIQNIEYNGKIKDVQEPTKKSYTFKYWSKEDGGEEYDLKTPVTENLILYAVYEFNGYKVTYMVEESIWKEETIKNGYAEDKMGPEKEETEQDGKIITYQFDGWYKTNEYLEKYDFETLLTDDITLYGRYIETKTCKTRENAKIPTKEEIISSLKTKDQIIEEVEEDYNEVNLTSSQTDSSDGIDYVISDGFKVKYKDEENNSYEIVDYTKETLPDTIKIPDKINNVPVVKISGGFNEKNIKTIKISKTLQEIGGNTFESSTIKNIDFSNAISLKQIGDSAFKNAKFQDEEENLVDVNLENTVNLTTISGECFNGSTFNKFKFGNSYSLSQIIDTSFNHINGSVLFDNTINLESLNTGTFNNSIINIFNLGNSINLLTIQEATFEGATIESLKFSNTVSLQTIEANAFKTKAINGLDFGNSVNLSNIKSGAFYNSNLNIDTLDLRNLFSLVDLSSSAFSNSGTIENIIIGSSIETIGSDAFTAVHANTVDFDCATNLTNIEMSAFYNNNIKEIKLIGLEKLKKIDSAAFSMSTLETMIWKDLPSLQDVSLVLDHNSTTENYPAVNFTMDNVGLTKIPNSFMSDTAIGSVTLKNLYNLETIEMLAFNGSKLNAVSFNNLPKLKKIGYLSFAGSIANDLEFNQDDFPLLETIDTGAFKGQTSQTISFRNLLNLRVINSEAFEGAKTNKIIFENLPNLEEIGDHAFVGVEITKLEFNSENTPKLTKVGEAAFATTTLKEVTFKDLPLFEPGTIGFIHMFSGTHTTIFDKTSYIPELLDKVEFINIPNLRSIPIPLTLNGKQLKKLVIKDCENITFDGGGINSGIEEVVFENLPSVTTIFGFANNRLTSLDLSGLPNLETIQSGAFSGNGLTSLDLSNNSNLKTIKNGAFQNNQISNLNLSHMNLENIEGGAFQNNPIENIDLSYTTIPTLVSGSFSSNNMIKKINFTNSNIGSISSGVFSGNKITQVDLSTVSNLETIGGSAFAGNPLKKVKLPESLITIQPGAFISTDKIECVEILGDSSRFNNVWTNVGFPENLTSEICVFVDEEDTSLTGILGSIIGLDNKAEKENYSVVLFKMDSNKLIDDNKNYKLMKLNVDKYENVNMEEDYDGVGRYNLNNYSKDLIKPYKNKIYISNIETGLYKLVNEDDKDDTLTFIVEQGGVVTGNARISGVPTSDKIISEAQAELITSIQTGVTRIRYLFILIILAIGLSILVYKQKKYIN